MAAKVVGCSSIIALDITPSRLQVALQLSATQIIQLSGDESPQQNAKKIREIVPSGLDFAIDTSGNKIALRSGFESLKPLGVCALIGGSGQEANIDMSFLLHGRSVRVIIQCYHSQCCDSV